jgi:hypothetical protein
MAKPKTTSNTPKDFVTTFYNAECVAPAMFGLFEEALELS